jgi:hypothetical protein
MPDEMMTLLADRNVELEKQLAECRAKLTEAQSTIQKYKGVIERQHARIVSGGMLSPAEQAEDTFSGLMGA